LIDTIYLYELIEGNIDFKRSDIATINNFAEEHKISIEELRNELIKFSEVLSKNKKSTINLWIRVIDHAIKARKSLVNGGTYNLLDTVLNGLGEYRARIIENSIYFVQKKNDDEDGSNTGIPNAYYWEGTPGMYLIKTIMNFDHDILCLDGGSYWFIKGINKLKQEIKSKYDLLIKNESYNAKYVKYFCV